MLESLERREMLSGGPTSGDAVTAVLDGGTLVVRATDTPRQIRVSADPDHPGELRVEANRVAIGSFTGVTAVTLEGGAGADELIAAPDVGVPVTFRGLGGDDTIVAASGRAVIDAGAGDGLDAIWAGQKTRLTFTDPASPQAKQRINRLPATFSVINDSTGGNPAGKSSKSLLGSIGHTVSSAAQSVARGVSQAVSTVAGAVGSVAKVVRKDVRSTLRQPKLTDAAQRFADFSSSPLFAVGGPSESDIGQGALNDCYVLSALAAVAQTDPSLLRRVVTDLGDGTFAVRLMSGGAAAYYRVDATLPTLPGVTNRLAYAQMGQGASLWAPLVEKALALAWGGSYSSLDRGGWMTRVFGALGIAATTLAGGPALTLLALASQKLLAGNAVTIATRPRLSGNTLQLFENHAYTVESVQFDDSGRPAQFTLRNPYRWDGPGGDGVVTVDARTLARAMSGVVVGRLM